MQGLQLTGPPGPPPTPGVVEDPGMDAVGGMHVLPPLQPCSLPGKGASGAALWCPPPLGPQRPRHFPRPSLCKDIVMCIPSGGTRTLPQGCTIVSLALSLHPLPSLISNCLNLSFETQGRSWRLESIPYKQEMGDTERLLCPGAPQGPAGFQAYVYLCYFCLLYISKVKGIK